LVVLFSDGLVEAAAPGGKPFGTERVINVVRANMHEAPDTILTALLQAVNSFSRPSAQVDDMTAVVIKVARFP
jgi:sigma-B regulation protein RsbU (phosphoserine phosphatase)